MKPLRLLPLLLIAPCLMAVPPSDISTPPDASSKRPLQISQQARPLGLGEELDLLGLQGAVVIVDSATGISFVEDSLLAKRSFLPASTFKILNTLIALETGVATDSTVFRWDGVDRGWSRWNRDMTLREALPSSAVWVYQEIARRVGKDAYRQWIDAAMYGNGSVEGELDSFWLDGGLRISAWQQVEFLINLLEGRLPFSEQNVERVRHWLAASEADDQTMRIKSGLTIRVEPQVGWYVGWIEREQRKPLYFAALVVAQTDKDETKPARRELARVALRHVDLLPEGMEMPRYDALPSPSGQTSEDHRWKEWDE